MKNPKTLLSPMRAGLVESGATATDDQRPVRVTLEPDQALLHANGDRMIFGFHGTSRKNLCVIALAGFFCIEPAYAALNHCQLVKTQSGKVPLLASPRAGSKVIAQARLGDELEVFDGQSGAWRRVRRWHGVIPYKRVSRQPPDLGWIKRRDITDCDIWTGVSLNVAKWRVTKAPQRKGSDVTNSLVIAISE